MPGVIKNVARLCSSHLMTTQRKRTLCMTGALPQRFQTCFNPPVMFNSIHYFPPRAFRNFKGFQSEQNSSLLDSKTDLNRFLFEIGTDPKEARYWLTHFSSSRAEGRETFAVVCVDQSVMDSQNEMESFASAMSFLYRNGMLPVIIYGSNTPSGASFLEMKNACVWNALKLSDLLESHGTLTSVLYPGCGVVEADTAQQGESLGSPKITIQSEMVKQSLASGHLPILLSFGETSTGQMMALPTWDVTAQMARKLQPLKVLEVNTHGGFLDSENKVIANINLPSDLSTCVSKPWCTAIEMERMARVNKLLVDLPPESSVVISSSDTLLKELFTHRGSGTFFKVTEAVHKYSSLDDIDLDKLTALLNRSFEKTLSDSYLRDISSQIHAIYLSETYSGVAILLKSVHNGVPYMCKFAVSSKAQGQGTGEILWDVMRQSEQTLFWRSKTLNPINMWYFKKCEGCWNDHVWSVFWFGINDPSLSSGIIQDAIDKQHSFLEDTYTSPKGKGELSLKSK